MSRPLHWIVPGSIEQRTGGYIYDRSIVEGLRDLGWQVELHELAGRFPDPDDQARAAAGKAVDWLGQDLTVIDGLALLAFEDQMERLPERWVGLIHHPLYMETGVSPEERERFAAIEGRLMHQAAHLIVTSPGTKRDLASFDIGLRGPRLFCRASAERSRRVDRAVMDRGSYSPSVRSPGGRAISPCSTPLPSLPISTGI